MHCPSCGQQQISSETKFCSRCGLPLGTVAEVLAHGGYLPQLAELNAKKTFFNKKNGVVLGIFWFIFVCCFMTAFFAILNAAEELVALTAVTGFFGSVMIIAFSLIFLKSSRPSLPSTLQQPMPADTPGLYGQPQQMVLPPQSASVYGAPEAGNWRDTNDLQPANPTEGATKLLDRDEKY